MAGVRIGCCGWLKQGYYNDDKLEYFGREIRVNGESYIGGYYKGRRNGKGEVEKADGSRQILYYVNDRREGAAKYYDEYGNEEDRFYKNNKLVGDSNNSDDSEDFELV